MMKTYISEDNTPLNSPPPPQIWSSFPKVEFHKFSLKAVSQNLAPKSNFTSVPKAVLQWSITICLLMFCLLVVLYVHFLNTRKYNGLEEEIKKLVLKLELIQNRIDGCELTAHYMKSRRERDLTYQGIPVYDSSYRRESDSSSEGLRIYEDWVTGNANNPQSGEVTWETSPNPLQQTRRRPVPDKHSMKTSYRKSRVKYKDSNAPSNYVSITTPFNARTEATLDFTETLMESLSATVSDPFQGKDRRMTGPQGRHQRRRKEKLLSDEGKLLSQNSLLTAIHLEGDTSNYTVGVTNDYLGNGRLRNVDDHFTHWKPTWPISNLKYSHGIIYAIDPGLYYIYAQVHYVDKHDISGYRIYVNDRPVAQCTIMARGHHTNPKSNTCFTGALVMLSSRDKVFMADLESYRYSVMRPAHSFFGMVKLGDAPQKTFNDLEI